MGSSPYVIVLLLVFLGCLSIFIDRYQRRNDQKLEGAPTSVESNGTQSNIFINSSNEAIQISTASANHNQPFSRGDFVVWIEESQNKSEKYVVRYHTPTGTTLYVTSSGISQNAKVTTEGYVVWQQWTEHQTWQIFYFDGFTTQQISSDATKSNINPDMSGNKIVYASKDENNEWLTFEYSLDKNETKVVQRGIQAKNPYFYGSKLFFR